MEIINLLDPADRGESDFKKQFAEDIQQGLTSSHKSHPLNIFMMMKVHVCSRNLQSLMSII